MVRIKLFSPVTSTKMRVLLRRAVYLSVGFLGLFFYFSPANVFGIGTAPGQPTGLTGTPVGSQITLSWTAPTNNGGEAISDYLVEFRTSTGNWSTFNDGVNTTASATVTGLNSSTTYLFRVSAININGTGAASSELSRDFCSDLDAMESLTGLILWLRADCIDGTPVNPLDGDSISIWEDLSGSDNDAETVDGQASPTFQNDSDDQINGQPVLNFTRTDDNAGSVYEVPNIDIRATTNPEVSIFVVYKPRRNYDDEGNFADDWEINGVWGADDGGWDRFFLSKFQYFGNDGLISLGPGSSGLSESRVPDSAVDDTTRLLTAIYDSGDDCNLGEDTLLNSKIYFGSTLVTEFCDSTTTGTDSLDRLYIGWDGDGSAFRGDIAEFIVFDQALSSDLPTINEYLNDRYNLELDISTNLPDVVLVDPRSTVVNFPSLDLSTSTDAMICFNQATSSSDSSFSGSPNISVTRTSNVSGVTETTATNDWRYSGTRANVDSQIDSIQITGVSGNPVVTTSSKWVRVRVTSSTTDCAGGTEVERIVELRPVTLRYNRDTTVTLQ